MAAFGAQAGSTAFGARLRLALTLVCLLAFALQGYWTQTHIHLNAFGAIASEPSVMKSPSGDQDDKYPPGQDPANCPLCQEFLHSGAYVTPSFAAVILNPFAAIREIPLLLEAAPVIRHVAFNWRGRAPPQN